MKKKKEREESFKNGRLYLFSFSFLIFLFFIYFLDLRLGLSITSHNMTWCHIYVTYNSHTITYHIEYYRYSKNNNIISYINSI